MRRIRSIIAIPALVIALLATGVGPAAAGGPVADTSIHPPTCC